MFCLWKDTFHSPVWPSTSNGQPHAFSKTWSASEGFLSAFGMGFSGGSLVMGVQTYPVAGVLIHLTTLM